VLKRSLLLLTVLLACDETRDVIVSYRVPANQGGMSSGGNPQVPEPDAGPAGGTPAVGGAPDIDSGSAGDPSVAGGGSGGAPPTCIELPRKPWVAIGNPSSLDTDPNDPGLWNPPLQAVDDKLDTRWSTGFEQAGGEWLEVDFGHPVTLTLLELDHKAARTDPDGTNTDFPAQLLVSMSERSRDFGAPILADVEGTQDFTMVSFAEPATGRYLLLQQIGTGSDWWSIHELIARCEIAVPAP
jgi:hypothetical protein